MTNHYTNKFNKFNDINIPLIPIKFGSILQNTGQYLESLRNYEFNDENSSWEIGINDVGTSDQSVKELPHMIKVNSFNFIPIHTFVPRLQRNIYNSTPEIGRAHV